MWSVHFECVVGRENACRFYRCEVSRDMFDAWQLDFVWGRIGTNGIRRQIARAGNPAPLWDRLIAEAGERFRHGYVLVAAELPQDVMALVQAAKPKPARMARIDARRADKLMRARAILAAIPGQAAGLTELDGLIDRIDPARRRARSTARRGRPRAPANDLFAAMTSTSQAAAISNPDAAEVDAKRELFRSLVHELLDDDPLVARGVLHSLEQPKPYEADTSNVVQLRPLNGRLDSWTIDQFIHQAYLRRQDPPRPDYEHLHAGLARRLRHAALRTVADLMAADVGTLVCQGIISENELRALSRACGDFNLRLSRGLAERPPIAWASETA